MASVPEGSGSDTDLSRYRARPDWQGWVACAAAGIGFGLCLGGWLTGGGEITLPWAPTLDLHLSFALDGLGALYALLATGIGALVFCYGTRYLTLHLRHENRPLAWRGRFWAWMLLFAVSMVGLATAQDLILLFVFFDLTAVCSYFLIGFDRVRDARGAALMALLITVVGAVAMLLGAVLLYAEHGTFAIPELISRVRTTTTTTTAAALLAVAAVAKSAQVPLHFWLPRAMAAPTPVSAYLHSAAMVAAGVLVLGRVHPVLDAGTGVLLGLLIVGTVSIVVGGLLALGQNQLKQLLAYSTISQYGYVVLLYGIGGGAGNGAAAFYVLTHAVAKSALFMTAGAVTMATGKSRLSQLGGLARRNPVLAVVSGIASATLAALPLTAGFFKDELLFDAALDAGPVWTVVSVLAAALTFAYIGRFWCGVFLGPVRTESSRSEPLLVAPILLLAAVGIAGGVFPQLFAGLASAAGAVSADAPVHLTPAYHLDLRPVNVLALLAWAIGAVLLVSPRVVGRVTGAIAGYGASFGPARGYAASMRGLNTVSSAVHDLEVRDLRTSIAAVFVPSGVLVALALVVTGPSGTFGTGHVSGRDWLTLPLLALITVATVAAVRTDDRLGVVLALSVVGFGLAGVYALLGAPDVALVAVLIETMVTLVFLTAVLRLPEEGPDVDRTRRAVIGREGRRWRNLTASLLAGFAVFVSVWGFLSHPAKGPVVGEALLRLAPLAHGKDAVTVIVADFRGLDTLVEITVLLVAVVGAATLLGRGRLW